MSTSPNEESVFIKLQPIIRGVCRKFQLRHGGYLWDLMADCYGRFVEVYREYEEEENGDLNSFIVSKLWNFMYGLWKKDLQKHNLLSRSHNHDMETIPASESKVFDLQEFLERISPDYRDLVHLALSALFSGNLLKIENPIKVRVALFTELFNSGGWTRDRIYTTFQKIRKALL